MKLKYKILTLLLLLILILSFVGCAKCIGTEYQNVEVTIVDKYHRASYILPMHFGKTIMMIPHPAVYQITVYYNGIEYAIDDIDAYNKYKDKIGQTAIGKLEIKTYDDGTVEHYIVSLE